MTDHRLDTPHPLFPLSQRLEQVLMQLSVFGQRRVHAELHADDVVLKGVVRSYYHKQLAQETVRAVPGVKSIRNEIIVAPNLLTAPASRATL